MTSRRRRISIFTIVITLTLMLAVVGWSAELRADQSFSTREQWPVFITDPICDALFREYIEQGGKISPSDMQAASNLIVSRGRPKGYGKIVFEGLNTVAGRDEIRYIDILGKMLEKDSYSRDAIKAGTTGKMQMAMIIAVPDFVVPALIDRSEKADTYVGDSYVIALARARDERTQDYLMRIMKSGDTGQNWDSMKFHAAVGLANMGDKAAVNWLIGCTDDSSGSVSFAWPKSISDNSIAASAIAALRVLSGQKNLSTKSEFEDWWKTAEARWEPKNGVLLVDSIQ